MSPVEKQKMKCHHCVVKIQGIQNRECVADALSVVIPSEQLLSVCPIVCLLNYLAVFYHTMVMICFNSKKNALHSTNTRYLHIGMEET